MAYKMAVATKTRPDTKCTVGVKITNQLIITTLIDTRENMLAIMLIVTIFSLRVSEFCTLCLLRLTTCEQSNLDHNGHIILLMVQTVKMITDEAKGTS